MVLATVPLIGRYEHLKNRPKSDQALPLLEKIASQVKPVMTKRGWKVGILGEFFPSDPSLLGINISGGQRINLRLRPPGSPDGFYEYDQLVLVMLHELTHIQFGPHDASFYKLLGELEEEYYDLKRKGYSGEGFHSSGNHLSGLKVDEYQGKLTGLQAAERRLAIQKKMGKGGVLGGGSVLGRSMKEVLAEAAERRMRDDQICHTHGGDVEAEVRKAEEESEGVDADQLGGVVRAGDGGGGSSGASSASGQYVNIPQLPVVPSAPMAIPKPNPQNRPHPQSIASSSRTTPTSTKTSLKSKPIKPKPQIIDLTEDDPDEQPPKTERRDEWSCPTCTLFNPVTQRTCEACTAPNPNAPTQRSGAGAGAKKESGGGWFCDFCGSGPRDMSYWSCGECGWVRKWG